MISTRTRFRHLSKNRWKIVVRTLSNLIGVTITVEVLKDLEALENVEKVMEEMEANQAFQIQMVQVIRIKV